MYSKTASASITGLIATSTPTQNDIILKHLEQGKPITQGHATLVYGISRLSSCIDRLRSRGVEIDSITKFDEVGKQYAEYRIRRDIQKGQIVQVKKGHCFGLPSWVKKTAGGKVVGLVEDVAFVQFETPQGPRTQQLNVKELLCA
ncbi:hypothetical protein GNX71_18475 [Variovorax sp. RKNM96]|uniref:helix-turn-helix domain-containing protein n=1 Tax=Variovorax sp. RKNM96 TaxID=2681552 RepID=UPI00197DD87B|nr:helix-turn-helix domain-containing protein [Variovorax sp. RKNM96]QSI31456.1 hypothetical protein GNX71_18475 [Variovorax sp. RKNM96]